METLTRIYQGYATPKQMLVICGLYYAAMAVIGHFKTGGFLAVSNLGIISIILEWSLGLILMYGAWRSFKNYEEDRLRVPMILFAFFGSMISLLFGVLGGDSTNTTAGLDASTLQEATKLLNDANGDVIDVLKSLQQK